MECENWPIESLDSGNFVLLNSGLIVADSKDEMMVANSQRVKLFEDNTRLMLTLLPTMKCNFECRYCYESDKVNGEKSLDCNSITEYVLGKVKSLQEISIGWFGGEPTLAIPTIIRISKSLQAICLGNGLRFNAGMTTNGFLLDINTFRILVGCGIRHYHITVDGPEIIHDSLRPLKNGGRTFQTIMSNLRNLAQTTESYKCRFTLRINVCRRNFKFIESFVYEIANIFGKHPSFGVQITLVSDYGGERVKQLENELLPSASLLQCRKYVRDAGLRLHDLEDTFLGKLGKVCYAACNNHLALNSEGTIFKCTCFLYDYKNIVGNVGKKGIVLNDEALSKWTVHTTLREKCKECVFYPICFGIACPKRSLIDKQQGCSPDLEYEIAKKSLELLSNYNHCVHDISTY